MKEKSIKFWAIVLIVVMCITTMSLFGFLSYINIKKSLFDQYEKESQLVIQQAILSVEPEFGNAEKIIEQLSHSLQGTSGHSDEIKEILHTYQKVSPSSGTILYGLENNTIYYGNGQKLPNTYHPLERDWYKFAIQNEGELIWTEPYLDYLTKKYVITASKAVTNSAGTQGVVAFDFNLDELSNMISNSKIGKNGFVMLVNPNGTVLANRDNRWVGESLFDDQFEKMIAQSTEDHIPYVINNHPYIIHSKTIEQNNMSIVTAICENELKKMILNSLLPIIIGGLGCLLLFSLIAYLGTIVGVQPLKKLGSLMNSVENGNYSVRANERDYKEIARLSIGFNSMIQAINKRDSELNSANEELKIAEEKLRRKYEELKVSEEKVTHLAMYDSLTGLLNRRSLLDKLSKSLPQNDSLKAVIFIDLDNFKTVNDTLGHTYGDKLIVEIAKKLQMLEATNKDVARISGDEFVVVIHELLKVEDAKVYAEKISGIFTKPIIIDGNPLNVTASIGIAISPIHANTSEELIKIADMAMYRAKNSGKNGYQIFDESIKQEIEEKLEIEVGIQESLETNQFELFFQPLYNIEKGRITSVEALLRNKLPALSKYNIGQIIQTAEQTGQIVKIDNWVLREACNAIKEINKQLDQPISMSVNISSVHIMQPNFVKHIREIIEESKVPKEYIHLEITETSLMESFETNKEKLYELKKLGISLHLDDFGTGYSSLNYLNSLPIDRVKMDKSFIDDILLSETDSKIVETIIHLAHNIGLHVVAEGVEQKEQFDILEKYGCNFIQGYYLSKPISYSEILDVIKQEGKASDEQN